MGEDLGTLEDEKESGKNIQYEILKGEKNKWSRLGTAINFLKVSVINRAET